MTRSWRWLTGVLLALAWLLAVTSAPALAQTVSMPTAGPAPLVPPMFGDWIDPDPAPVTSAAVRRLQPLAATYSAFKVAENESPVPMDRLFVTYNFYRRVLGTQDIHRQTLGVEKTLIQGDASLGLRLPFFQIDRDGGPDIARVDDLTLIFKYAVLRGALSTGLAVTLPTGPSYQPAAGGERTIAQLQPYARAEPRRPSPSKGRVTTARSPCRRPRTPPERRRGGRASPCSCG